ncbi:MAG: hypothetical protein KDK44_05935, partial [Chlamydiia bacterium]|nr:hypothetical protein [Chlamydiia bacterium]
KAAEKIAQDTLVQVRDELKTARQGFEERIRELEKENQKSDRLCQEALDQVKNLLAQLDGAEGKTFWQSAEHFTQFLAQQYREQLTEIREKSIPKLKASSLNIALEQVQQEVQQEAIEIWNKQNPSMTVNATQVGDMTLSLTKSKVTTTPADTIETTLVVSNLMRKVVIQSLFISLVDDKTAPRFTNKKRIQQRDYEHPSKRQKYEEAVEGYVAVLTQAPYSYDINKLLSDCNGTSAFDKAVKSILLLLTGDTNCAATDYRSRYQKLNLAIEAALQNKAENVNEHNNKYDKFLQDLIYVRWSGLPFWHYLLSLPETFREFSGDYVDQAACMPRKENFHNWVYNANTTVNSAPNSPFLRKGVLQKMAQMWEGNVGTRFIDMNIPHPISTLTFEKDGSATEVSDNRYPSVTTAGSNGVGLGRIIAAGFDIASFNTAGVGEYFEGGNGEDILPEYSEFLRICRDKKIGVLLTSHQTMISRQHIKGGSKTEDESGRVNQLRGLEKDHPNYFCLVQPFYGSFFEKYGSYNETKTFAQFKENVIDAFTSESPEKTGCALPAIFNDKPGSVEAYRQTLGDLFDQVHGIFFENKEVIGLPSWMKGRETPWNGISNLDENQKQ